MNKVFKTILITVVVCILLSLLGIGFIGYKAGVSMLPFENKIFHGKQKQYAIISENSGIGNLIFQPADNVQAITYRDKVYLPKTKDLQITVSVCEATLFGSIGYDCGTRTYVNPACVVLLHNKSDYMDIENQMYIDAQTAASCEIVDATKASWKRIYYTIEY